MPENTAQQELQNLLDLQGEAQSAQDNLAKVQEARTQFNPDPDAEADFAWPEGAATAIAAGWLLGPVGGLLMGVAQGLYTKRQRQNALDTYINNSEALGTTADIFHSELDRLALTATNPNDVEQLSAMQTEFDTAMQLMANQSPELQQKGTQMLASAHEKLNGYTVRQEEQAIAAQAHDDQMRRDMDATVYSQHRDMFGDFKAESSNFEAQMASADNIMEAVNRGDGGALTSALATLPLLVNPQAGATTDAEVAMWNKIGGTVDGLIGRVQKELGSGGMTDGTRKEILEVAAQFKRNTLSYQQAREAYYGSLALERDIPATYRRDYNLSGRMPVVQKGGFVRGEEIREDKSESGDNVPGSVIDRGKGIVTGFIDDTSMMLNDKIDAFKHEQAWREEFFRIHGQYPADDLGGKIR